MKNKSNIPDEEQAVVDAAQQRALAAKLAGVSPTTLSRVLNRRHLVSEDTARRVDAAIKQVGYEQPTVRGRGRPIKKAPLSSEGNLGLLLLGFKGDALSNFPVFPTVLQGIERACAAQGRNLLLGSVSESGELPRMVTERQVDGLLLMGWFSGKENFCRTLEQLPSVSLMSQTTALDDHIVPDNQKVAQMAADYLIEREMAFVSVDNERAFFIGMENIPATINIQAEEIGARGVERLIERLESGEMSQRQQIFVQPKLIVADPEVASVKFSAAL